jgi:hypothetical protein
VSERRESKHRIRRPPYNPIALKSAAAGLPCALIRQRDVIRNPHKARTPTIFKIQKLFSAEIILPSLHGRSGTAP